VKYFQLNTQNPELEKNYAKEQNGKKDQFIGDQRNLTSIQKTADEKDTALIDFYMKRDIYEVDAIDKKEYNDLMAKLKPEDKSILDSNLHFYELHFTNIGGLVMPLIIRAKLANGQDSIIRIPAEIWRMHEDKVSKVFIFNQEVMSFRLDPFLETADTDLSNNAWPCENIPTRYQLFKQKQMTENPMQRQKRLEEMKKQ
jgi:hypothetical protein